jgi:hypothetical protein
MVREEEKKIGIDIDRMKWGGVEWDGTLLYCIVLKLLYGDESGIDQAMEYGMASQG